MKKLFFKSRGQSFFPCSYSCFLCGCLACLEDFSVEFLNYGFVFNKNNCAVVFVENLVVAVMFADEIQKLSADVFCTFMLQGGLNQITFLCLFLRLFCTV